MKQYKFAIFILSNGRANNISTIRAIEKAGYTGKYYIVCDNEDETLTEYIEKFGNDNVKVFNKKKIAEEIDTGTNDQDRRAVVFARNACFDLAKELNLDYFMELDDDYVEFEFRRQEGNVLRCIAMKNMDKVISIMIRFLEDSGAKTIAMAQGGDLIGGAQSGSWKEMLRRKAMNSFVFRTNDRLWFVGKSNEDVSTYVTESNRGVLFFTFCKIALKPKRTQSVQGGMTEFYSKNSGFTKPFSSVIFAPQAIKVSTMGENHKRFHHLVSWNNCAPKILNAKWKKRKGKIT